MAHSLSAKKRIRQNEKRRQINRTRKTTLKGKVRKVTDAFVHNQPAEAEKGMYEAVRALDREASRSTLHPNAAARRKSRMAKRLAAMKRGAAKAS